MVVIIILGVLAAVIFPRVLGRTDDARRAKAVADVASLEVALSLYAADNGRYPTTAQGLEALRTAPTTPPLPRAWAGPYLEKPLQPDPWGSPYVYTSPGVNNSASFDLMSYGGDGEAGGGGNDADVVNWE